MDGIRWLGRSHGSGFGDASSAYLHGLREAGVPVSWTPLGWPSRDWGTSYGPVVEPEYGGSGNEVVIGLAIDHEAVVVHSVPVWHDRLRIDAGPRQLVAFTTWETDRLPPEHAAILNRYDVVLVPSQFNRAVFEQAGVRPPVRVVPHIAPAPSVQRPARDDGGPCIFYTIATWSSRKAILDTVAAYLAAFTAQDDVLLSIHTTARDQIALARLAAEGRRGDGAEGLTRVTMARALAGRPRGPRVAMSTGWRPRSEVEALHRGGDCFVSLSRAEGWGLGAFDAVAFGNPAIVTGWGGTPEFLPENYPYLVGYELVPTQQDPADAWWAPRPGERWAKASIGHAAALMREVFEQRREARRWGCKAGSHVRSSYSSEGVTWRLLGAIRTQTSSPASES